MRHCVHCVDLNNDLDNLGDLTWDKVSCDPLCHIVLSSLHNTAVRIGRFLQVSSEHIYTTCVSMMCYCVYRSMYCGLFY